jgi:hypothetical protein
MTIITQTQVVFDVPEEYVQALNFNRENTIKDGWYMHSDADRITFTNKKECEVSIKEKS